MDEVAIGIGGGVASAVVTSVALRRQGLLSVTEIRLWATVFAAVVGALVTYLLAGGARP